jgi:general stress protein 26
VHDDRETQEWFYEELATALYGDDDGARWFERFLDSPRRVVLEVEPTRRIAYDGKKMARATAAWIAEAKAADEKGDPT